MNASEQTQDTCIVITELIVLQRNTLPESITVPVCKKTVKTLLGDEAEQEITKILLSNNTIQRRVLDLSTDIEENVQNKLSASVNEIILEFMCCNMYR